MTRALMTTIIACGVVFAAAPLCCSTVPAGSSVSGQTQVYMDGRYVTDESFSVTVPQIYGLRFDPPELYVAIKSGETRYFPCALENLGNGTDRVLIDLEYPDTYFTLALIVDENGDGVHQSDELTEVPDSLVLGEGAAYHFFVEIAPPQNKLGGWVWATLTAQSSVADGASYVGYNGLRYGGSDKVVMMISASVE